MQEGSRREERMSNCDKGLPDMPQRGERKELWRSPMFFGE